MRDTTNQETHNINNSCCEALEDLLIEIESPFYLTTNY